MTQPSGPTEQVARWEVAGPAFASREDIRFGQSRLGTDYNTNTDGRFADGLRLGPKIQTVELSAVGGTAANTNGFVRAHGLFSATEVAVVTRGTDPAIVRLSDFAVCDPAVSLASRALSPLYSKNAAGTETISVCLAAATYRNITALTAATNLCTNPEFETNTTDWTTGGSNTIASSTDQALAGTKSMKATYQDNAVLADFAVTITNVAHTVVVGLYIPANYDGGGVAVKQLNYTVATSQTAAAATTGAWQDVVLQFTPGADVAGNIQIINTGAAPTAGRAIYIDSVILKIGNDVTRWGPIVTESACNEAITNQVIFEAYPNNVIYGGGAQVIRSNEISGAVTMDASAWVTRGTVTGDAVTFTDGKCYGDFPVFGTDKGAYAFDPSFKEYRAVLPELGSSANNCHGMARTSLLGGVLVPMGNGLWLISEGGARSVGIDRYTMNQSPIQGRVTAIAVLPPRDGFLIAVLNPVTTDTTLCYARPSNASDPFAFPLVFFPVATLTGIDVECAENIDTADGQRTNPTVVFGHDDDLAYITRGRIDREVDDTNYLYGSTGVWYGSEMLRCPPGYRARVLWVEVTTAGCTSAYYAQAAISLDGGSTYQDIGATTVENGTHRFKPPSDTNFEGVTIKPRLSLTGVAGGTSSPVIQQLTIGWVPVPNEVSVGY